MHKTGSRNV